MIKSDMPKIVQERRYTIPPEEVGYWELSAAIIRFAVEEYRYNMGMLLEKKCVKYAAREVEELRKFFGSQHFGIISGLEDPQLFLRTLDEQIKYEAEKGIRHKRKYVKTVDGKNTALKEAMR